MVRILVLSFLFKGESFSFVRGLWLLDLDNRKTFLVEILGSPLHLVFFDGDWKIFCFLAFGYLMWDRYIFSGIIVLSTGGRLQLGRFYRVSSTRFAWMRFVSRVFISINAINDFILLFFCSICFFLMMQQIWYGWRLLCRREGVVAS